YLEAAGVEDGDEGVENRAPQPHGLHLGAEAFPFFQTTNVVVRVLALRDALDGGSGGDPLRALRVVVRFLLVDDGELPDEEGPEMGVSSRRAQAQPVFAERSVGEDADPRGG